MQFSMDAVAVSIGVHGNGFINRLPRQADDFPTRRAVLEQAGGIDLVDQKFASRKQAIPDAVQCLGVVFMGLEDAETGPRQKGAMEIIGEGYPTHVASIGVDNQAFLKRGAFQAAEHGV